MHTRVYHFTCKRCGHEYLKNNCHITPCPECGEINQTDRRIH